MLESTISGTPRFATFPTDPDSTQTSYPSRWAMRADNGSKMFAARVHVGLASTLRNRSQTWDIVYTSSMNGLYVSVHHLMGRHAWRGWQPSSRVLLTSLPQFPRSLVVVSIDD